MLIFWKYFITAKRTLSFLSFQEHSGFLTYRILKKVTRHFCFIFWWQFYSLSNPWKSLITSLVLGFLSLTISFYTLLMTILTSFSVEFQTSRLGVICHNHKIRRQILWNFCISVIPNFNFSVIPFNRPQRYKTLYFLIRETFYRTRKKLRKMEGFWNAIVQYVYT